MRINILGLIASILVLISLVPMLAWWTLSASMTGVTATLDVYPYKATMSSMGSTSDYPMDIWFGWTAFAFVIISGILGIVGSFIVGKMGKTAIIVAGILALLAIIIFAVGLQNELSNLSSAPSFPSVGLFSSFSWMGADYISYLSVGFWIALVASILQFVALIKHPSPEAPPAETNI